MSILVYLSYVCFLIFMSLVYVPIMLFMWVQAIRCGYLSGTRLHSRLVMKETPCHVKPNKEQ